MNRLINKNTWLILGIILVIEALSFVGNSIGLVNQLMFGLLVLGALFLSLKDLKYGILIVLLELFVGSMGYLYSWPLAGERISLRLGLFLVVMAVWLYQEARYLITEKKLDLSFIKTKYWKYYLVFFIVLAFAWFNGLVRGHDFGSVFLDGNSWLYLLLIFPLFRSLDITGIKQATQLLLATSIWLSAKTMFVLFVSAHKITWGDGWFFELVYKWIRDTRIGEITMTEFGFYRIFFQSHVFVLLALFVVSMLWAQTKQNWKNVWAYLGLVGLFVATLINSMSRSLWVGLAVGLVAWLVMLILQHVNWKQLLAGLGVVILGGAIGLGLILAVVKFPVPEPLGADALAALTRRTQGGDSALSSRWNLLPPLWEAIKQAPWHGQGFGAAVTYRTNDPHVLETSADGLYTTSAFEWGWLDTWLEFGLLGLLIYLALYAVLIYRTIKDKLYQQGILIPALIIGLLSLVAVNIFTPYLNHPLGLGWLILTTVVLEKYGQVKRFA